MACAVNNNAFEVIITPSRKRKRDSGPSEQSHTNLCTNSPSAENKNSVFTNSAFSSTPKKEVQSLIKKFNRFPPNKRKPLGKENDNHFPADPCLEIKSILDLVNKKPDIEVENPYEVIRKPPKKKKRACLEEACFINTGLNLELPEKQFNPFEVKRESPTKYVKAEEPQCFVNPALNIRSQETSSARNPFEIQRVNESIEKPVKGIENQGLDLRCEPLKIGIPFKPTLGCRIDFTNITPSKMFAEKLVFSPMNPKTPQVLANIPEEETSMDIGRELDRYQLELENSINEAKQRKTNNDVRTFSEKLEDIVENSQEEEEQNEKNANPQEPKTPEAHNLNSELEKKQGLLKLEDVETPPVQKILELASTNTQESQKDLPYIDNKTFIKEKSPQNESFTDDEGIDYDDTDDDNIDFKAPAPFVRAYRKADSIPSPLTVTKNGPIPTVATENKSKVKNIIRNSLRKLINHKSSVENKLEQKPLASSEHHSSGHHFMESIRHSLRRKPQKQSSESDVAGVREISIIDVTERRMKFQSHNIQTEYIRMEDIPSEKKSSLRNSIRKSTRGVKNQIMKSVFNKKNEEYDFAK